MTRPFPRCGLSFRVTSIMGSNIGTVADLEEVARLVRPGKLAPFPATCLAKRDANAAMLRLRDGKVTLRLVLTADWV